MDLIWSVDIKSFVQKIVKAQPNNNHYFNNKTTKNDHVKIKLAPISQEAQFCKKKKHKTPKTRSKLG